MTCADSGARLKTVSPVGVGERRLKELRATLDLLFEALRSDPSGSKGRRSSVCFWPRLSPHGSLGSQTGSESRPSVTAYGRGSAVGRLAMYRSLESQTVARLGREHFDPSIKVPAPVGVRRECRCSSRTSTSSARPRSSPERCPPLDCSLHNCAGCLPSQSGVRFIFESHESLLALSPASASAEPAALAVGHSLRPLRTS
jgi:hypothetical protein